MLNTMRVYDLVLVLRPKLTEVERKKVIDSVTKILGEVKSTARELGKKVLSYPIKKETEGAYVMLNITSENGLKSDIDKKLLINDNILRHLLVRRK